MQAAEHWHVLNTWGKNCDDLPATEVLPGIMCMCVLEKQEEVTL